LDPRAGLSSPLKSEASSAHFSLTHAFAKIAVRFVSVLALQPI
jgi:hypothetical protein